MRLGEGPWLREGRCFALADGDVEARVDRGLQVRAAVRAEDEGQRGEGERDGEKPASYGRWIVGAYRVILLESGLFTAKGTKDTKDTK